MATTTTAPPSQVVSGGGGADSSASGASSAASSMGFGGSPLSDSRLHACAAFLAGDETVHVIPQFNYRTTLGLVSRPVGPFRAGVPAPAPLWLACYLRRRNLCRIVPPDWLDVDELRDVLRHERDPNEASFSPRLPFRHAEVARAVLSACGAGSDGGGSAGAADDEIPNADQIRLLLEDIQTVRMDKIRRNVHTLSAQSMARDDGAALPVIDVTGIGSLEMHAVRPFVATAFRDHRSLTGKDEDKHKQGKDGGSGSSAGRGANAAAASAASAATSRRRAAAGSGNNARTAESSAAAAASSGSAGNDDDGENYDDQDDEELLEPTREPPATTAGRSRIRRFR